MPFFMHMDLLSEFIRVNYVVENWSFYPSFNRLVIFYVESFFYQITQWFVVNPDILLHLSDPKFSTASTTQHFIFVGDPHVYRHIFLFKLPYLVFDLLCARLIWCYFVGHQRQVMATTLWLFNPVTIYSTYIFGRFEVISLFFLLWTAVSLKNHRWLIASVMLGLAINSREINLIFIPAFFIALISQWRLDNISNIECVSCGLVICFSVMFPYIIESIFSLEPLFTKEANVLEISGGLSSFFESKYSFLYLFFFLTAISYFSLIDNKVLSPDQLFVMASICIILPFFIDNFRSAHYFSWAIPFLVLACMHTQRLVFPIFCLFAFWVLYWMLNPAGAHFTPLLATPIHESLFGLGNLLSAWQNEFSTHAILNANTLKDLFMTLTAACMSVILIRVNQKSAT